MDAIDSISRLYGRSSSSLYSPPDTSAAGGAQNAEQPGGGGGGCGCGCDSCSISDEAREG